MQKYRFLLTFSFTLQNLDFCKHLATCKILDFYQHLLSLYKISVFVNTLRVMQNLDFSKHFPPKCSNSILCLYFTPKCKNSIFVKNFLPLSNILIQFCLAVLFIIYFSRERRVSPDFSWYSTGFHARCCVVKKNNKWCTNFLLSLVRSFRNEKQSFPIFFRYSRAFYTKVCRK